MAARTVELPDIHATEGLGAALAPHCRPGDVIFLIGDLGAGKTSLSRGLIRQFFGNPTLDVPSPSYLLQFTYRDEGSEQGAPAEGQGMEFRAGRFASLPGVAVGPAGGGGRTGGQVQHLDLYRLKPGRIAGLVDFDRIWREDISLVEWPDRLGDQLSSASHPARLEITLSGSGPQGGSRRAELRAVGDRWTELLRTLDLSQPAAAQGSGNTGAAPMAPLNVAQPEALLSEDKLEKLVVLGIESSCDDTGAAVVRADGTILGEALASQAAVHEQWGGVVPNLAREAHAQAIDATVEQAISKAGLTHADIDAVAVTVGPGLAPCLQVGVGKAYQIAAEHQIPIVRVHHMEAHAMITRLPAAGRATPDFPYATVLVSGGHNMVLLTTKIGEHCILGSTLDDSIGESFDKTARLLGITQVPGGPHLEKLATSGDPAAYTLPKPLSNSKDPNLRKGCDFSFSGLKTSTRTLIEKELRPELARPESKAMIVAGGVAANKLVRSELTRVAAKYGLEMLVPPGRLCVDNGVMVAWTGIERLKIGLGEKPPSSVEKAGLFTEVCRRLPRVVQVTGQVRPRWVLGPRDARSQPGNREKPISKKQEQKRKAAEDAQEAAKVGTKRGRDPQTANETK